MASTIAKKRKELEENIEKVKKILKTAEDTLDELVEVEDKTAARVQYLMDELCEKLNSAPSGNTYRFVILSPGAPCKGNCRAGDVMNREKFDYDDYFLRGCKHKKAIFFKFGGLVRSSSTDEMKELSDAGFKWVLRMDNSIEKDQRKKLKSHADSISRAADRLSRATVLVKDHKCDGKGIRGYAEELLEHAKSTKALARDILSELQ